MDVKPFQFAKIGNMASPYPAYREIMAKRFRKKMDASRLTVYAKIRPK
jgi:hypothetical protein